MSHAVSSYRNRNTSHHVTFHRIIEHFIGSYHTTSRVFKMERRKYRRRYTMSHYIEIASNHKSASWGATCIVKKRVLRWGIDSDQALPKSREKGNRASTNDARPLSMPGNAIFWQGNKPCMSRGGEITTQHPAHSSKYILPCRLASHQTVKRNIKKKKDKITTPGHVLYEPGVHLHDNFIFTSYHGRRSSSFFVSNGRLLFWGRIILGLSLYYHGSCIAFEGLCHPVTTDMATSWLGPQAGWARAGRHWAV